jgi:hypothetical protein
MDAHLLHATLRRFRRSFLAFFPALTMQDYHTLLAGEGQAMLDLLQLRYGCTPGEAKGAWNEFVLRHVDGCTVFQRRAATTPGGARKKRCHGVRPRALP